MKECKKCREVKPEDSFGTTGKYQLNSCKVCVNKEKRERKHVKIQSLKLSIDEAKVKAGCVICGWNSFPIGLDLHHVDPDDKSFGIAAALRGSARSYSFKAIHNELEKCCVICANCHRGIHGGIVMIPDNPERFKM